ncbi:gamma-cadinene synthase-like isoform X2 [Salvia miltiorrhiza]|uniref:gamma-cadinene synthase-like isoform X2 n=1 Tax=Salvia miltiorrhiza TaxID=226208 RepID=UPI0025ACD155|nr:gamma-cadinene synthase-like isoform X2 [Salvia miltiorrhiza]
MAAANMVTAISSNVRHIRPPIVTYKPNMWGHIFSTFSYDHQVQEKYSKEMEALKKEIRSMLMAAKSTKLMVLIDQIERLGLSYHFEIEIEEKLKQVYDAADDCDLFTTALRFRLLRQHQYHVSCTVFDKFVEKDCKWIGDRLRSDVEGILSLYEAAHVRIRDEKILDEALEFTVVELNHMLPTLESPTKEKVQQALKHSIHRSLPLLNIRFYISVYERDGTTNGLLLKLAKLNFNFLQNIYRKELAEIMRWWDKFDLKNKLPYARDRMVECYLWGNAFRYEPQYSYLRVVVAKNMQLATIMDDTYDNYGTLEEDDLFTDMLERWNLDEIDVLPEFMKVVYRFIMSVYEDYVGEAERQGKSFAVPYYRETVKQLSRAYNKEQKWIMERQMPPYEEYMTNSVITSCMYVMFTALVPGMKSVNEEAVQWLLSEPKIVISIAKMGRTLDDLGSHERENREGKLPTVVDCYMKDKGVSKQETISEFVEIVENEWKDITAEWAKGSSFPKELVEQLLNYGRIAEITYNNKQDCYTDPEKYLGPLIAALYTDPLLI